jgi:hypothetical protein
MADAIEVAIEGALLTRLRALTLSPAVTVSLPNVPFTPPTPVTQTSAWLRATFLPAPSMAMGVQYDAANRHSGIFQVDVFYGQGGGELAPARIASTIIQWFPRGSRYSQDSATVEIGIGNNIPRRGQMLKDDPWVMIPVSIPYVAYANPA